MIFTTAIFCSRFSSNPPLCENSSFGNWSELDYVDDVKLSSEGPRELKVFLGRLKDCLGSLGCGVPLKDSTSRRYGCWDRIIDISKKSSGWKEFIKYDAVSRCEGKVLEKIDSEMGLSFTGCGPVDKDNMQLCHVTQ